MKKTINIAKDFSKAPAGRYRDYGDYSAERFREEFLVPAFQDEKITEIEIILDGLDGIGCSFWDEAFGMLIKKQIVPTKDVVEKLTFVCSDDITLKPLIEGMLNSAVTASEWYETEEQIQGGFSEETIELMSKLYDNITSDDIKKDIEEMVKKELSEIKCRKSNLQEYQCQVTAKIPWKSRKKSVSFDACLAKELFWLWDKGITTTGCCCGKHVGDKKNSSYIGVLPKFIDKMKELGYKIRKNNTDETREDSFVPKTNFDNK